MKKKLFYVPLALVVKAENEADAVTEAAYIMDFVAGSVRPIQGYLMDGPLGSTGPLGLSPSPATKQWGNPHVKHAVANGRVIEIPEPY